MKYRIQMVHGDNFHNFAQFTTDAHGVKAMMSALKDDKTQSYPFRVLEKKTNKVVFQTSDWQDASDIHECGYTMSLTCSFCCVKLPESITSK